MGYRIAVLDPDIDCPSASVADELVIGAYDDVGAALRLAGRSAVVTYELEHIAAAVVAAIEPLVPVRPGHGPLVVTHDRIAERRFVEGTGIAVAPWREVRTTDELRAAAAPDAVGLPLRLKASSGGYDGRGQIRVGDRQPTSTAPSRRSVARPAPPCWRSARSTSRRSCRSSSPAVSTARPRPSRSPATSTTPGSSSNRWRPRRSTRRVQAGGRGHRPAPGRGDGPRRDADRRAVPAPRRIPRRQRAGAARPQQRPLDHRGRRDLAVRAAHPRHLRAGARAPPRRSRRRRWSTCWARGRKRAARLTGVAAALADPDVHLHLYDKREVFERRKMGHVTALGPTVDAALDRARAARAALGWAADPEAKEDR